MLKNKAQIARKSIKPTLKLHRSNCRRSNYRRSNCRWNNCPQCGAFVTGAIFPKVSNYRRSIYRRSNNRRRYCRRSKYRWSNCRWSTYRRSNSRRSKFAGALSRSNCRFQRSNCRRSNYRRSCICRTFTQTCTMSCEAYTLRKKGTTFAPLKVMSYWRLHFRYNLAPSRKGANFAPSSLHPFLRAQSCT